VTRGELLVVDPSLFTLPYDHELCRALVQRGERVRLVGRALRRHEATASAAEYRFEPLFADPSGAGRWRAVRKGIGHVVGLRRLQRLVQEIRPKAVFLQWLALAPADRLVVPSLARACPLLLTAHDASAGGGRGFGGLQTIGWRGALRHFDHLIVHTREGAATLRDSGVDRARIHVIGHPVLPLAVPPSEPGRSSTEPLRLVIFGEIKPYKGIDVAIEAIAKLPGDLASSIRLTIAGRPRMDPAVLKETAERFGVAGRVEWLDRYIPLNELPEVLGCADAYLMPYRSADASGVMALLLQLGRPIIASRTGSLAEIVGESGCGILVAPGDAAGLAAAIERLIRDPESAAVMGTAAARASADLPSWDEMAALLVGLADRASDEER